MWRPALPRAEPSPHLSRFFVQILGSAPSDRLLRIRYRRWNHVSAARPFTQIDGAAAVTAEGKVGIAVLHRFLADRAAEFQSTFARHGKGKIPASCVAKAQDSQPTARYKILATRS